MSNFFYVLYARATATWTRQAYLPPMCTAFEFSESTEFRVRMRLTPSLHATLYYILCAYQ